MALTKVTYAMIEGDPVNVLDFGAVGDNSADDTAAIQAAINAASVTGQELFFPAGTYLISANLTHPDNAKLYICGEGLSSIIQASAGVTKVFDFGKTSANKFRFCGIRDLVISSGDLATTDFASRIQNGIYIPYCEHSQFKNIRIGGFGNIGLYVGNGYCNLFEDIVVWYNKIGFEGRASFNQNLFNHCQFWLNEIGAYIGSGAGNVLNNCLFESNSKTGAVLLTAAVTFEGCYFEGNARVAAGQFPAGETAGLAITTPSTTIKSDIIIDGGSTGIPFITSFGVFAPTSNVTISGCSTAPYAGGADAFVYVIASNGLVVSNCYNNTTSIPVIKTYQSSSAAYSVLSAVSMQDNQGFSENFVFDAPADGRISPAFNVPSTIIKESLSSNFAETNFLKWAQIGGILGTFSRKNIADKYGKFVSVWELAYNNTADSSIFGFTQSPANYPENIGKTFVFLLDVKAENANTSMLLYGKTNADGALVISNTDWKTYAIFFTWPASGGPFVMGGLAKSGNVGSLYVANPVLMEVGSNYNSLISQNVSQVIWTGSSAAPTTGNWLVGDFVQNATPAVGQPKGWMCTVAGTPGTWVSTGNL